jgi:hypothetical protein
MLTIKGIDNHEERAYIREFVAFTLGHLVSKEKLKKADIKLTAINISDLPVDQQEEFEECSAWMGDEGRVKGRRKFTIDINKSSIKSSGSLRYRMRDFLVMLSHELVHVKQYLNGELFDYANGIQSRFHGKLYLVSTSKTMDWDYYNSPWEVEAYGRSEGIYNMFCAYRWEN